MFKNTNGVLFAILIVGVAVLAGTYFFGTGADTTTATIEPAAGTAVTTGIVETPEGTFTVTTDEEGTAVITTTDGTK